LAFYILWITKEVPVEWPSILSTDKDSTQIIVEAFNEFESTYCSIEFLKSQNRFNIELLEHQQLVQKLVDSCTEYLDWKELKELPTQTESNLVDEILKNFEELSHNALTNNPNPARSATTIINESLSTCHDLEFLLKEPEMQHLVETNNRIKNTLDICQGLKTRFGNILEHSQVGKAVVFGTMIKGSNPFVPIHFF
jgi:hypothetical protein